MAFKGESPGQKFQMHLHLWKKISPKFCRSKFCHGCRRGMFVPLCMCFKDFDGLTKVFDRRRPGPAQNLLLGLMFLSFLNIALVLLPFSFRAPRRAVIFAAPTPN